MAADERDRAGEHLGPFQDFGLGRAGVGDDRVPFEAGCDVLEKLLHRADRRGDDDDIGVLDGFAEVPRGTVDGALRLREVLLLEVGVVPNDPQGVFVVRRPAPQRHADRAADEPEPDDGDLLHFGYS